MRTVQNPYSSDLLRLRDAINSPFDPRDFLVLLPQFAEEKDLEIESYERMSPEEQNQFSRWLKRGPAQEMPMDYPEESPLYLTFSDAKILPPSTWLVHFSPAAHYVSRGGFLYGQPQGEHEFWRLPVTKTKSAPTSPGWNFAFKAMTQEVFDLIEEGDRLFGTEAVLFQAACVFTNHYGDQQRQAIFLGKDVHSVVYLQNETGRLGIGTEWSVSMRKSDKVLVKGDYERVARWVMANYENYRKVL